MENDQIINLKSVVVVSDKGLAAALYHRDVRGCGMFLGWPRFKEYYLFPNTNRVRRIVKAYVAGTLRVQARQYSWEIKDLESYDADMFAGYHHYLNLRMGDGKKR